MSRAHTSTHENRISEKRLQTFRWLFVAREDAHARRTGDQPVAVREPLSDEVLAAHLAGEYRVGTYLIKPDGKTPFLVIDVDLRKRSLVKRILRRLHKRNVTAYVERSKSKRHHIWIFFDKPLLASKARAFAKIVLREIENRKIEIFPKQDKIRRDGLGNCIFLPLFGADASEGRTVFLDEHFAPIKDQWSFLQTIRRTPKKLIIKACRNAEPESRQLSEPANRLGEAIKKGTRNKTLTSLAGAMRHQGATEGAMLAALLQENQERCRPAMPPEEVRRIAKSISRYEPGPKSSSGRDSQATRLVALAGAVELFHTPDLEAFGTGEVGDHYETWRLRDSAFKRWLASQYYEEVGKTPSSQAVADALGVMEGRALYGGPKREVYVRIGNRKGAIYIDLCDPSWRAIKVTCDGWEIVTNPPVKFRRSRGMKPLPLPHRGGSIDMLKPFLNVSGENSFVLLVSWVVAGLRLQGPFPVLVLLGEAGSAKSTTARVLRELIDPNTSPLRAEPRDVRDLMVAARNSWCVAFDNVSHLPPWLSDALCRLATGGGFSTRELYTDDQEKIFEAMRPVLLNGIDGVVTRGDLMDRSLIDYLPAISAKQRLPEKKFWQLFRKAQPLLLGSLLDALVSALRRLPTVKLERRPRMADFAEFAVAAEQSFGWPEGTFMCAYDSNLASANALTLDASPLVPPLKRLTVNHDVWSGTAADLLRSLVRRANDEVQQRNWPKNPQVLSGQLRRIAPNLRAAGIDVQFDEKTSGSGSKRMITIKRGLPEEVDEILVELNKAEKEPIPIRRFPRLILRFPRLRSDASDASDAGS
jgi:hypothetical protein